MRPTLKEHVRQHHGDDLADLFAALGDAAVLIESRIRIAALSDVLGAFGQTNVQGEQQQKLDVLANNTIIEAVRALPTVAAVVSEENEAPIVFEHRPLAKFVAIFDPLDGSSNIDVNVNVGTIVSIAPFTGDATVSALQPGTAQVAGLYVNYGPSTVLVYTAGSGVHNFTLADGQFLLTAEHLRLPLQGPYYSLNEANIAGLTPSYATFLHGLRDGTLLGQRYSSRYVGSFIADFHRTLLKGGVFLYPPTQKTPHGKLRLLYECNPLSFIAEQAGGAATDGVSRILEKAPSDVHQRTPLVIGSQSEVNALRDLFLSSPPPE